MTLDELIEHEEKASKATWNGKPTLCAEEHRQLAEWLKDYKRMLEQEPCEDVVSKMNPINECSQIRCPFNATTFENCSMTKKECPYFTRQFTNGDILKAIFPDLGSYTKSESVLKFKPKNSHYYFTIGEDWWNTVYKGDVTVIKEGEQNEISD